MNKNVSDSSPLKDLDALDEERKQRYETQADEPRKFRDYETTEKAGVREFYRINHQYQTLEFVLNKKNEYLPPSHETMGVWEAMETLNTLVDDSDPDTSLTQIDHLLQTAEAIRADGHPDWFVLTGLIHDLGKLLCLKGEPQWAVVGDTFPVGCRYSPAIVYHEFFAANPDSLNPQYQTECGIYKQHCGLDKVHFSWGHDEYLYQVVKNYLPEEALAIIRYHSCYPIHKEHAYAHLMNEKDEKVFAWVRAFQPYDLYSKSEEAPNTEALTDYYQNLIARYFPTQIAW